MRDFSADRSSGIRARGKYLGLAQEGAHTKGGYPTGLDHLKALGITHLQLMPVFDFGYTDERRRSPQYNWGYDPMHFNVPEGSYSSDPYDGAVRVRELKQAIRALHRSGISVVMDVVYNHVYDLRGFCFQGIVPDYFLRVGPDGVCSNGSGCGCDTATERAMVRKYIVDSLTYWASAYHIDGFRFDLAGLIDLRTIQEAMQAVRRLRPSALFYGEGWRMDTRPTKPHVLLAVQENAGRIPGFGFFNDSIRDALRGSVFDSGAPGYVSGAAVDKALLERCFMGAPEWAAAPGQSINYVSCHDNHTLFDRIRLAAPEAPREVQIAMNRLAAAFTLLAQGVPFLLAGEELLRSKPGRKGGFDANSYRAPDRVNALKWGDLDKPEYRAVADFYRGLIAFRKAHPALRLTTREEVARRVRPVQLENPHAVAFYIDGRGEELFLAFSADTQELSLPLPEGRWEIHIRGDQAGNASLGSVQGVTILPPISALGLVRKKPVEVVAALIWEKDKFLICQRPAHKARGLLWEFAGGKVEPGETLQQALVRECAEELAVAVEVREPFMEVQHRYPDIHIRLTLFHCVIPTGHPQALEHADLRWIHPSQIDQFDFCPADKDILEEIQRQYQNRQPL